MPNRKKGERAIRSKPRDLFIDMQMAGPRLTDCPCASSQGERLGIIGPSGAGKSTFLLHLNGVFLPAGGFVRINGQTVERKNLLEIRRHVGIVFRTRTISSSRPQLRRTSRSVR